MFLLHNTVQKNQTVIAAKWFQSTFKVAFDFFLKLSNFKFVLNLPRNGFEIAKQTKTSHVVNKSCYEIAIRRS